MPGVRPAGVATAVESGWEGLTVGPPDSEALLALAESAARAAGAVLLERYGAAGGVETKSSATDPVTEADRASEALLVSRLLEARPDDGLLGEEGSSRPGRSGLRWVIDPLDGTVNYLYGLPAWSVSVACEDGDGALVGVVHDPVHGETFTAVRGGGAFMGGRRLRVNDPVELGQALVATGFLYDRRARARQAATVARVLPAARDVRRFGSAALDLCALACGRVDGYYEDELGRWDWPAGGLVAAEAGAVVESLGSGVIAAGPALFETLRALVVGDGGAGS